MKYEQAIELLKHLKIFLKNEEPSISSNIYKAINIAITTLEKQIPQKPQHILKKFGKHKWKRDKNGEIDDFAWDSNFDNGGVCEVCGEVFSSYFDHNYDEWDDCKEEYWLCPVCREKINDLTERYYCKCGQVIDWKERDTCENDSQND